MSDDPQQAAESLDEDVIGATDISGDEYGEGLPDFPPDEPVGVDRFGVTPAEQQSSESFSQRTKDEVPEQATAEGDDGTEVGQIVEPNASTLDDEEELVAEEEPPGRALTAEEAAMHVEPES